MAHTDVIEELVDLLEKPLLESLPIVARFLTYLTGTEIRSETWNFYAVVGVIDQWNRQNGTLFLETLSSRDTLRKRLEDLPDELKDKLPGITDRLKLVPGIMEKEIKQAALTITSESHAGLGRPKKLKFKYKEQELIAGIFELIKRGSSEAEAKRKIAKQYGLSLSTVDTVWKKRATIEVAEPSTLPDLFRDLFKPLNRSEEAGPIPTTINTSPIVK
jgi:hypothetical protein